MEKWHTKQLKNTLIQGKTFCLSISLFFVFVCLSLSHTHTTLFRQEIREQYGAYGLGQCKPNENSQPLPKQAYDTVKGGSRFLGQAEIELLVQLIGYFSHKLNK